jgi:hypothetical protein
MAVKNKLSDVRDHLFTVIEGLQDEKDPMDINRANAIVNATSQIVNVAKVEVSYLKLQIEAKAKTKINLTNNFLDE